MTPYEYESMNLLPSWSWNGDCDIIVDALILGSTRYDRNWDALYAKLQKFLSRNQGLMPILLYGGSVLVEWCEM